MGYESNFEVPDIDDRILRGVDDLTDLNCPSIDDFNHQYHGTFTYSFTCDYFFFPVVRSRCERVLAREIDLHLFCAKYDYV